MVKEAELWADDTPEMMSEEEMVREMYIRHPPAYQSQSLDKFISKLDICLDSDKNKDKHPRADRKLGSPRTKPIPIRCKNWMMRSVDCHDISDHEHGTLTD